MKKKFAKPTDAPSVADSEFTDVELRKPVRPTYRESKVTKHLQCKLTDHEIRTMGQELARANAQAEEVESRKKAIDADLKGQIEAHVAQAMVLSRTINNGYQYKDVECMLRFDYATNTVTTMRTDRRDLIGIDFEVIDSRVMTAEERQVELKFEEEPAHEVSDSELSV